MAKEQKDTNTVETAAKQEAKQAVKAEQQESVYTVAEFAENSDKLFNTKPECVVAALRAAEKETCTLSEAREIVDKFLKKEVK
ncbi:MAG: hypothetical protein IJL07_08850 [Lachnospiraceae bacterium]|nr:hypothetical protein [Lachnospiraceae bacterium]